MSAPDQTAKSEAAQDQAFMLSRCLELWVTDLRRLVADIPPWNDGVGENPATAESFFPLFAASLQVMRIMPEFSRQVMPAMRDIALRSSRKMQKAGPDQIICALLGEEFARHCEVLAKGLCEHSISCENAALRTAAGKFGAQAARLRKIWNGFATDLHLPAISGTKLEGQIAKNATRTKNSGLLLTWRDRWRAGAKVFGSGGSFGSASVGKAGRLFELWCFYELAHALRQGGHEDLAQSSLLRGTSAGDFYIDCRWRCHDGPIEDALTSPGAVSWFFKRRTNPNDSALLDVKYKKAAASACLHLLGAMTASGVRRGVLFCRRVIDFRGIRFSEPSPRFALARLDGRDGVLFCAAQLVPSTLEMLQNEEILRLLIQTVLQ